MVKVFVVGGFISLSLLSRATWGQERSVTIIEVPRDGVTIIEREGSSRRPASPQSGGYSGYCNNVEDAAHRQSLTEFLSSGTFDRLVDNNKMPGQLSRVDLRSTVNGDGCRYFFEVTYTDAGGRECVIEARVSRARNNSRLSGNVEITRNNCD